MTDAPTSDALLRRGLEAAGTGPSDDPFAPEGLEHDAAMELLEDLLKRGWVQASPDLLSRDAGRIVAARGVGRTAAGQRSLGELAVAPPTAVNAPETWVALRRHAEPHSPLSGEIDEAVGDLASRGLAHSGIAIGRARAIAYDHRLE